MRETTNIHRASLTLTATLPVKPSVTTTSTAALGDVLPLHVADEVEMSLLQLLVHLPRQVVALVLLFADVEQAPLAAAPSRTCAACRLTPCARTGRGRRACIPRLPPRPASARRVRLRVGGRRSRAGAIPGSRPRLSRAEVTTAPVLPADTTAAASPSLSRRIATLMEASRFLRTAGPTIRPSQRFRWPRTIWSPEGRGS